MALSNQIQKRRHEQGLGLTKSVQLLDMVDNSISPCELISGRFSPHSM